MKFLFDFVNFDLIIIIITSHITGSGYIFVVILNNNYDDGSKNMFLKDKSELQAFRKYIKNLI